jgi:GNAT superfamily N-acetyltransferase
VATLADVDEIVRVTNLAYRVEDFFINGTRTHAGDIRARMHTLHAQFFVIDAVAPGRLAASVYAELRGEHGYFGLLAVDPAEQGQGLSRLLIYGVEAWCRQAGCSSLHLGIVNLREELPAFYRKWGFEPCGIEPFPDRAKLTREAHLVLMRKPIRK